MKFSISFLALFAEKPMNGLSFFLGPCSFVLEMAIGIILSCCKCSLVYWKMILSVFDENSKDFRRSTEFCFEKKKEKVTVKSL